MAEMMKKFESSMRDLPSERFPPPPTAVADLFAKIKDKEMAYKRYREDREVARMMEEQKALKQMRRTMVPHARAVPNFNNPFVPEK